MAFALDVDLAPEIVYLENDNSRTWQTKTMEVSQLQFEKLDLTGLKTLVGWAIDEGWNAGPHDAEAFYATDPDGFYGYYRDGELIAGGAIVSYGGNFGFMGLFIVRPGLRGQGIGRKLWYQRRDMLLKRLKPGAAIGMDGVVAMQPFYSDGGFEIAFRDERHENTGQYFPSHPAISPITHGNMNAIKQYDLPCFGVPRDSFLEHWIFMPGNYTFKFIEQGKLKGYAVVRQAKAGHKICPLFADDLTTAEVLYKACLSAIPGEKIYLDIPVINADAETLTRKFNTTYVFECARMYSGTPPKININKVFGITTFELG